MVLPHHAAIQTDLSKWQRRETFVRNLLVDMKSATLRLNQVSVCTLAIKSHSKVCVQRRNIYGNVKLLNRQLCQYNYPI
jgi:hypothetical protein